MEPPIYAIMNNNISLNAMSLLQEFRQQFLPRTPQLHCGNSADADLPW
jgi:hypothetical protein